MKRILFLLVALAALMSCASPEKKRRDQLVDLLHDESAEKRLDGLRQLRFPEDMEDGRISTRILNLTADPNEEVQARAAIVIGQFKFFDVALTGHVLIPGTLTAMLFMKKPFDRSAPYIADALEDEDARMRRLAVCVAAVLGEAAAPELLKPLSSADPVERRAAARALEMISAADPAAVESSAELLSALRDSDPTVRLYAVKTLSALGRAEVADALDDSDRSVREAAAWGIGRAENPPPNLEARLLSALQKRRSESGFRAGLIHSLGRLGLSERSKAALERIDRSDRLLRLLADRALARPSENRPVPLRSGGWAASDHLASISSPRAADLNGDGVKDLVVGRGAESLSGEYLMLGEARFAPMHSSVGYATAYDGRNGETLWQAEADGELFGAPLLIDLNRDGVSDAVIGGRNSALIAVDGAAGERLWSFVHDRKSAPLNFYTAQPLNDQNGDGVSEILIANGGDPSRPAFAPRPAGRLMVLNGADGALISPDGVTSASAETPDRAETYMSAYWAWGNPQFGGGSVLFGTGGETQAGALWSAPLAGLLRGDLSEARQLTHPITFKGAVAPPALADLTGDGTLDIAAALFDGRIAAIDGSSGVIKWERIVPAAETWGTPAPGRFNKDKTPDLFVSFSIGRWPFYAGSVHMAVDGRSGEVLWKEERDEPFFSSPLTLDMDGDGVDEALILIADTDRNRSQLYRFSGAGRPLEAVGEPYLGRAVGTPLIDDLDGDGTLEIALTAFIGPPDGAVSTLYVESLGVSSANHVGWGGYLGTRGDGVYLP